jgi:hypothetical protein
MGDGGGSSSTSLMPSIAKELPVTRAQLHARVVALQVEITMASATILLSPEIDWSIWAKKRAAIKMGFEDNHGWGSESAHARVFLGQIRPCIFIVIRVQFS